jgi:hypothetical protein
MMGHGRRLRQMVLLAAEALPPAEAAAAHAHAESRAAFGRVLLLP